MERPRDDTPAIDLIEHSAFTVAGVAADPAATGQETGLAGAHDALRKILRAREDLNEERLRRRAVLVVKDRACDALVKEYELRLYALVHKDRSDPLYRRYFPQGLRAVTEADMREAEPETVEQMILAMQEDASQPDIGPLATEMAPRLQGAVADVWAAEKALTGVESKLAYLRDKTIPSLRAAWEDEYVKLHGSLRGAFPRDPQRVEAFFLPFRKEKDRKKPDTTSPGAPPAP